ncbi:MAG: OsmC family protein [Phycisphaerales bacterium]
MHEYNVTIDWTGAAQAGTTDYKAYTRDYDVLIEGKPTIGGSSDPNYKGDASRHNPEDMLVASVSACHMLWYLHLCAVGGVVVVAYTDRAVGRLSTNKDGSGEFERVILRPRVTITPGSDADKARDLHHKASELCFIARSLKCPIDHEPEIVLAGD